MGNSNNSESKKAFTLEDEAEKAGLKVIRSYKGMDYGPLDFYYEESTGLKLPGIKSSYANVPSTNFIGGSYLLATPKEGTTLTLYRLYGGQASALGQYWMTEKREGNMSTQIDLAIHPKWDNNLSSITEIKITYGFCIMFGRASSQSGFGGGGFQVFIPKSYLEPYMNGNLDEAYNQQKKFIESYEKKIDQLSLEMVENFQTLDNAIKKTSQGNLMSSLPQETISFLKSSGQNVASKKIIKEETYKVHHEELHLPNGKVIPMTLSVRIEFSHETSRTYKQGNTTVHETTRYYKKTFIWS